MPPSWVFGPPAGERADGADYLSDTVPDLRVDALSKVVVGPTAQSCAVRVELPRAGTVDLVLRTHDLKKEVSGDATHDRPLPVNIAATKLTLSAGTHEPVLSLGLSTVAELRRLGHTAGILTAVAIDSAGERAVAARQITLT